MDRKLGPTHLVFNQCCLQQIEEQKRKQTNQCQTGFKSINPCFTKIEKRWLAKQNNGRQSLHHEDKAHVDPNIGVHDDKNEGICVGDEKVEHEDYLSDHLQCQGSVKKYLTARSQFKTKAASLLQR